MKRRKSQPTTTRPPQPDLFCERTAAPQGVKERARQSTGRQVQAPSAKSVVQEQGLLNVRQAAIWLGLSKSTLDKMRCKGKGPRFIKSTDRAVRYDPGDVDAWIIARRRTSTTEP